MRVYILAVRYDEDHGTLDLSVRELAYAEQQRSWGAGAFAWLRTELGRVVHRRVQAELAPGQTEVPLLIERVVEGVRCRIRGRADVVRELEGGWIVEEIKSVFELEDADAGEHGAASLQVQLYALALADEGREPVQPRLCFVEIEGDRRRSLDLSFDRAALERTLDAGLGRLLQRARAGAARDRQRREAAESIEFPHPRMRPGQAELIDRIAAALAEDRPVMLAAPTGTGKTAVALVPALREGLRRGAALWFLTAKTTQRELVAETFLATQRASGVALHAVVTRRKEGMCPPGHLRCHPDHCELLADFDARAGPVLDALAGETLLRPEDLLARGRATKLCPYELMHARAGAADLVVADHSHVYDPQRSRAFEGRRLVVIDEAHNLVDRARETASVFVARQLSALDQAPALTLALAQLQGQLRDAIDDALRVAAEDERPSHEGQARAELDLPRWQALGLEAGALALRYAAARLRRQEVDPRDPVLETLEAVGALAELAADPDPALVTYLAGPDASSGAGVGVLCLDPARRLEQLHRRQQGVIAMSATLEPLDYFADMLGLARLDPARIQAPSSFPAEHRCVSIVPTVRTTFEERDAHAPTIAGLIAEVLAARPGNYAVFFPSFRYLATVSACLDRAALTREGVDLLIQPPGASEAMRARVLDRLGAGGRPVLLLAAAGGVFAEGVDLPSDALIGAIVVGPALPAMSFERLLMQAHQRERGLEPGDAFAYAMAYPGMQRVIQAAGRVHRTPEDRGVIVLIGARFCEPPYCDALPSHWYDHEPQELRTEDLRGRLRRFWA